MSDSEETVVPKVEEKKEEEKPKGPLSVVIKRHGGYKELLIDPVTKQFVKKPKKLPSSLEITRMMRNKANERIVDKDGKILKTSKLEAATEHILRIARGEAEGDPKEHMAAITAYKEFGLRAYGKYAVSDEDKEALKTHGVRIVVVTAPDGIPAMEERSTEPRKPAFIDAEIVSTNPSESTDAEKNS